MTASFGPSQNKRVCFVIWKGFSPICEWNFVFDDNFEFVKLFYGQAELFFVFVCVRPLCLFSEEKLHFSF